MKLWGRGEESDEETDEPEIIPDSIIEKIEKKKKSDIGLNRFFKYPVRTLTEKPINILYICAPLAITVFLLGFYFSFRSRGISILFTSTAIDDLAFFSVLIIIVPLSLLDFKEQHRINSIEKSLPNFFRDLASMHESGMTLANAVHIISFSEYGSLTSHIKRIDNQISWNFPFIDAIIGLGNRLKTPLAERSVDLIARASKSGGDLTEILRAAASDTYEFVNLKNERKNNMLIYVIIIIASFFVFLFVIYILVTAFLKTMATLGGSGVSSGSAKFGGSSVDLFGYTRLFSHAAMFQGFFSGLAAGVMGEGSIMSGLKYSTIMLVIAWITFRFFV